MTDLVLGPLLRYAGETDATVWVETDQACEAEVRASDSTHRSRTFLIEGHHYALVRLRDIEPGKIYEYEVLLDGEKVWPEPGDPFPPPVIRTADPEGKLILAYGSCRVSVPHESPYTLRRGKIKRGGMITSGYYEHDALYALALRMRGEPVERWPHALLMLGDQIYADEVSETALEFIRSRRDVNEPPGDQIADFEEYTHLYLGAWKNPVIRWLLSTVPSAMIFDDHDVHDDWNTSEAWVEELRKKPWWEKRIVGAFMSYWIYQHLGNLSPEELDEDELFKQVRKSEDAGPILREFARKAEQENGENRWSFYRDFGKVRLIVMDSRAGRVLKEGERSMLGEDEWTWIEEKATGDFDHLLLGTSLPVLLSPGLHYLEAASEAVCAGAWGRRATQIGEKVRQALDLEHWSAFYNSFNALANLLKSIGRGERTSRTPPSSIVILSGDVHHGYLAEVGFGDNGVKSAIYQSVGSPLRNPLGIPERLIFRFSWSRVGEIIGKTPSRMAGVEEANIRWRLVHKAPWFDNHISTLEIRGREAHLKVEKTISEDQGQPELHEIFEYHLTPPGFDT